MTTSPNHVHLTLHGAAVCNPRVPCAGSLNLGRSTHRDFARQRVWRYGVRPFRTNPYAFVSLRVQDADRLILLGHMRYYCRKLADHRFELAASLPLPHGFTLDVGSAYQFGRHDEEQRFVLRLFKPLKNGGIMHVGLDVQNSPTCFAGISMPL